MAASLRWRSLLIGTCVSTAVVVAVPEGAIAGAGRLDRTFSDDGRVLTNFHSSEDWANDVAIQPDGKAIAVGIASPGGEIADGTGDVVFAMARYTRGGRLDPAFHGDGKRTLNFIPDPDGVSWDYEEATAVAVQADGKIVVVGQVSGGPEDATRNVVVVRLTSRGRLDPTFGGDGIVVTRLVCGPEFCPQERANDVILQPDGKILVGGCIECGGGDKFLLLRYQPGGRLDRSFGDRGTVITDVTYEDDSAVALALRSDGRILALSRTFDVVRYHPDGRVDQSFGNQGAVDQDLGYISGSAGLALQSDDKIVIAGHVHDPEAQPAHTFRGPWDFALVRLLPGGRLDGAFGNDGIVVTDVGGSIFCEEDHATDVAVQADGRIVAAGAACPLGVDFAAVRYRANGTLDRSFSRNGKVTTDLGGADYGQAVALRYGKLVVAGSGGPANDFALARYLLS